MAKLKKKHKIFIVEQLACFERPVEIVEQLKKHFGLTVSFAQVAYYNPEGSQGSRELARKWVHLFNDTRDSFISESGQIPIAHKNYRLRQLQKNYEMLMDRGDQMDACKVLDQAAKETGGAYNNNPAAETSSTGANFYEQVNQKIIAMNKMSSS